MLTRKAVVLAVVAGMAVAALSIGAMGFQGVQLGGGKLHGDVFVITNPTYKLVASKSGRIDYSSEVEAFVIGMTAGGRYKLTLSAPSWADFDVVVMDQYGNIIGVGSLGRGQTETIYLKPNYTGTYLVGIGSSNGATGTFTLKLWRRI